MPYDSTHPWISFSIKMREAPERLWLSLGEARSKCDHLAGVPLKPRIAQKLHQVYLAKGVHATAAIEGNTLSEEQVLARIEGKKTLPNSQEYLGKEIDNVLAAANSVIESVEKYGERPISVEEIQQYNKQILDGLELEDHVEPGRFRRITVGVMDYRAPPANECTELMEKLCAWLNGPDFRAENDDALVYGIIKAIVAHVYLAWIHPFGDGNGRTARMLEVRFLMEAGIPSSAIHLLSNHYNKTRSEYYKRLSEVSKNGGNLIPYFLYAVRGFVDLLREQLRVVKYQQWGIAWESYVYEVLGHERTKTARRQLKLALALSRKRKAVPKAELRRLTPELAELYANKTPKALSRDLNALERKEIIIVTPNGVWAAKEKILAFLPRARKGGFEAQLSESVRQLSESVRLTDEGGSLPEER